MSPAGKSESQSARFRLQGCPASPLSRTASGSIAPVPEPAWRLRATAPGTLTLCCLLSHAGGGASPPSISTVAVHPPGGLRDRRQLAGPPPAPAGLVATVEGHGAPSLRPCTLLGPQLVQARTPPVMLVLGPLPEGGTHWVCGECVWGEPTAPQRPGSPRRAPSHGASCGGGVGGSCRKGVGTWPLDFLIRLSR